MNEIIDGICQRFGIPPVDGQRIRATFCDENAIMWEDVKALLSDGKVAQLEYDPSSVDSCPPGYMPYWDRVSDLRGAFCPVFQLYFPAKNGLTPKVLLLLPEKVEP